MARGAAPAIALALSALIAACGGSRTTVRVADGDAPAPGARVEWRSSPAVADPPARAGTTGADGTASFSLPDGPWFLFARVAPDGDYARPPRPGDRFAYYGGNPVPGGRNAPAEIYLGLAPVPPPPPAGPPGEGSGVTGTVTEDGAPVAGATVFAYLRPDAAFRDMGFAASAPTGDDGTFVLPLPPGRYYVVVRQRAAGGVAGPLRKGDRFGFLPGNPVPVAAGAYTPVAVPVIALRMRNVPSYAGGFRGAAAIEGRILDRSGRPRRGVHAALYDNPDLLNRPLAISDDTGEDGRYRLAVPVPGTWYLGARTGYGGAPAPGDLYGRYEGNPRHEVTVRAGESLGGIDIVVEPVD